ncbi:triose-phosphate isomerase [Clostridium sp. AL.422]|uniref:triose-phosphate isomerase n=1 Tax=Clostridium TaxID=1485 RepID=UPI00293DE133|nr:MULTISPECIES: triose-phosphate isomerase [unclassified Clostridium]MDV4149951.1 triose-phosphate isomerase [Clostridium sp. AL.422]
MSRLDKLYIGTNTKMYKTISDTKKYLTQLIEHTKNIDSNNLELFVIPSFPALDAAVQATQDSIISIGAQNISWEDEGQLTGEVSPLILKEVGVQIVMIGHSERRHILGESDYDEEKKVAKSSSHGFTTLLCVGETLKQKNYNLCDEVLRTQIKIGLNSITSEQAKKHLWIAYEPVWSIGVNGIPANESYVDIKHRVIKDTLIELFGQEIGSDIPVLYGGSVDYSNAQLFIKMPNIDGLFIGRSAWDPINFNKIIHSVLPLFIEKKINKEKYND